MAFGMAPLTPQQNGRQSIGPTIRVTVDLVQVDAVVTDSTGRHVADLNPQDFQVFEDGRPQKITYFSYVSGSGASRRRGSGGSSSAIDLRVNRSKRFPVLPRRYGRRRFSAR